MERVGTLIEKLQEQLSQNADAQTMLVTAQLLQNELVMQAGLLNGHSTKKVAVVVPGIRGGIMQEMRAEEPLYKPVAKPEPEPIPAVEPVEEPVVTIPEPEPHPTPKPEPEPVPQNFWKSELPKPEPVGSWFADHVHEIPTLAHQEKVVHELNDVIAAEADGGSLNDKLKEAKTEVATVLQETPVKDLKKAISINDRHRFIHELFRGDETMYERSIKTINGFHIYAEAEYWIQRELKVKLGWNTGLELVKIFDQLVKRRFS